MSIPSLKVRKLGTERLSQEARQHSVPEAEPGAVLSQASQTQHMLFKNHKALYRLANTHKQL